MNKITKAVGISFIISLVFIMIIPIGNATVLINNTFTVGLRGDYLLHALIYLPWMFVRRMIFGERIGRLCWLIIGVITVAGLEYIQMILPYRGFNVNDIIAGAIGVAISLVVDYVIKWRKQKNI